MTIAEKVLRGKKDLDDAYKAGRHSVDGEYAGWYDTFWDNFQTNGTRTDYSYAFSNVGWNNATFRPKYPIVASANASYIFDSCALSDYDFVENGVVLDTSKAISLTYAFRNCAGIKRLGVIDCTGCAELNRTFYSCKVETIDMLVVSENLKYTNTFDYIGNLVNINIQGIIGQNGFSLKSNVLSKDSIVSIVNHLSDTTTGFVVTLSLAAVNKAFETSPGANDGQISQEWATLASTKSNWTISLV